MRTLLVTLVTVLVLIGLSNCQEQAPEIGAVVMRQSVTENGENILRDSIHNEEHPTIPYTTWLVMYQITTRDTLNFMPSQPARTYDDRQTFARVIYKQGRRGITHEEFKAIVPNADFIIYAERKVGTFVFSYQ